MEKKMTGTPSGQNNSKEGQGYNDARGEVPDKKDIPKNNGLNVNNDPAHVAEKAAKPRLARTDKRP